MTRASSAGTLAALDKIAWAIDRACLRIARDGAHIVQGLAMAKAPVGVAGNTTNPPGDLRRSIRATGPAVSPGAYTYRVAPWVDYGRQRELGGDLTPTTHEFMAFLWGKEPPDSGLPHLPDGRVLVSHVFQEGSFYLTRARNEGEPLVRALAVEILTTVVAGGGGSAD
jgi:hypothetical protein